MKLETSWLWIFKDQFWKLVLFGQIASLLFIEKNQFLGSCEGCMANVIMVKPKGISKHGVLPCALA